MTLDTALLAIAAFFAFWGAFSGIARQLGTLAGLLAASFAAVPLASPLAPWLAQTANMSATVAYFGACVASFIFVMVIVRYAVTRAVQAALVGNPNEGRALDRLLGATFGAARALTLAWVALSAMAFIERHGRVAGQRLRFVDNESAAYRFAKTYNTFELFHFADLPRFVHVAQSLQAGVPKALAGNADVKALLADPRVKAILASPEARKALKEGNTRALLEKPDALRLLLDGDTAERIKRIDTALGQTQTPR